MQTRCRRRHNRRFAIVAQADHSFTHSLKTLSKSIEWHQPSRSKQVHTHQTDQAITLSDFTESSRVELSQVRASHLTSISLSGTNSAVQSRFLHPPNRPKPSHCSTLPDQHNTATHRASLKRNNNNSSSRNNKQ